MQDRPLVLRGYIHLNNEYIIGKIIKNKKVTDKENCI